MQCLNCVPAIAGNVVNCRRKHTGPEPARKSAPLNISSTMRIRLLAQNIPASIVFIALIEIVLLVLSLYGAALVRFHQSVSGIERFAGPLLPRALTFGAIVFACQLALGLHSARQRARSAGIFVRIVAAIGMGVLLTGVCFFLIPSLWIGRGVVALAGLGAALIALLLHVVFAHFIDDQVFKIRCWSTEWDARPVPFRDCGAGPTGAPSRWSAMYVRRARSPREASRSMPGAPPSLCSKRARGSRRSAVAST